MIFSSIPQSKEEKDRKFEFIEKNLSYYEEERQKKRENEMENETSNQKHSIFLPY